MEQFRTYLKQEFLRRTSKNKSYSLRAFAKALDINHATLSSIISGKRKVTDSTVAKLSQLLGVEPRTFEQLAKEKTTSKSSQSYYLIQQDAFNSISDWYYDAILQLSLIKQVKLEPEVISKVLGISPLEAKLALETLERLDLIRKDKKGVYRKTHNSSTNILDPNFTNAAMKKYQRQILEKSLEALELIPKTERDHTSTTIAVQKKDLDKVKEIIKKFRNDLDAFLQRDTKRLDEVYQLQVSFFPLTNIKTNLKNKNRGE